MARSSGLDRRRASGAARYRILCVVVLVGFLALGAAGVPGRLGRHAVTSTLTRAVRTTTSSAGPRGPALAAVPPAPSPTTATSSTTTTRRPIPVAPGLAPASAGGEVFVPAGPWRPAGQTVAGRPAALVTTFRPAGGGPEVAVMRLDTSVVRVVPYAGTTQPGGVWSSEGFVEPALRPALVGAFNGGFQFAASAGGWYADGRVALPLRVGAASLVVYTDGTATVAQWGRDVSPSFNIAAVRQNLTLLVDGGTPVATVNEPWLWGATLGHLVRTWRSGVGDDGRGGLLYVGGPGLDPAGLAAVLIAAGARRAMEYDINPEWVLGVTFTSTTSGTMTPTKLLSSMYFSADHFFVPNWRDFVAAFAKFPTPAGVG